MQLRELIQRFKPREQDILASLLAVILGLTITTPVDYALGWGYKYGNIPYGVIWSWLNPGWCCASVHGIPFSGLTQPTFYPWYILAVQLGVTILMGWLVKKGKMNKRMFYLYMVTTIFYRDAAVFQEITPTLFLPFASINPLFALGFFLQKYPFWTLIPTLSDPHFQCVLGSCIAVTIPRGLNSILDADFTIHLSFLFWLLAPVYHWWMKRQVRLGKKEWNENKFWSRMTYILFTIIAYGLFWMVIVGCCYGYNPQQF